MFMVGSILGACRKGDEEGIQATGSAAKSATVPKTTAKATVQTGTNIKSTAAAATAATTTSISGAVNDTASANQGGQASINDEDAPQQDAPGNSEETVISETFAGDDIDLGGRTVVIGGWATWVRDLYIDKEGNPAVCRIVDRRLKAAEEKYNFKRGYNIPTGGSNVFKNEVVTKTLAGVKFADIVRTAASYDFASWVTQKIMLPLDEYIDYEAPIIKTNAVMYYGSLWKGRHYGIAESAESTNIFLMYNRALLEREGQRDILDLVEEKRWNWNAFLDMCKSVTKDLNGDGIIDQWGVGTQTTWYFIKYLLYSNGMTCGVSIDKDDNIQLILKQALQLEQCSLPVTCPLSIKCIFRRKR